jgi:hypothetical protein
MPVDIQPISSVLLNKPTTTAKEMSSPDPRQVDYFNQLLQSPSTATKSEGLMPQPENVLVNAMQSYEHKVKRLLTPDALLKDGAALEPAALNEQLRRMAEANIHIELMVKTASLGLQALNRLVTQPS